MKFLGKLKPFLIPLGLGIVGALIYERWIKSKLPAFLTGTATLLMLTLALAFATPDLRAENLTAADVLIGAPSSDALSAVTVPHLATIATKGEAIACLAIVGFVILTVSRSRGRKSVGIAALFVAMSFACVPSHAEVLTKGGALSLRPLNRETANFSYTNGVPNPGLPALLRVSTWQATNHLIVTTNGQLAVVNLGTNHIGFSGTVFNPSNVMFFRNGLLITTNSFQSP